MNKLQIIAKLSQHHTEFRHLMASLNEQDFLAAPTGKWNAGQQLDHICRSVSPVNLAFGLPGFLLRLLFGKANRASKSYDALVEKYQLKLANGGRASKQYLPSSADWTKRQKLLLRLEKQTADLCQKLDQLSENQLDTLLLPHPLLGKLTLREMAYFTIYHVQHHAHQVNQNLDKDKF